MEKLTISPIKFAIRSSEGELLLELEVDEDRGLEITYTNIYLNTDEEIDVLADELKKALYFYKRGNCGN